MSELQNEKISIQVFKNTFQ